MLSEKVFVELYTSKSFHGALRKALRKNQSLIPDSLNEDLIQLAFMRAWMYRKSYKPSKSKASTWIICIAGNIRREYLTMCSLIAPNVSSDMKGMITPQGQRGYYYNRDTGEVDIEVTEAAAVNVDQYIAEKAAYIKVSRQEAAEVRQRPMKMSTCHPDEQHYAKGLCKGCYGTIRQKRKRAGIKAAKAEEKQWLTQVPSQSKIQLTIVNDCSDNVRSLSATP